MLKEIIEKFKKFGVSIKEVPASTKSNKVGYEVNYEKYATGLQMIEVLKYNGYQIKNRQKGKFIVA